MKQQEPTIGNYRHYKGAVYRVIDTALNSETAEEMVVYKSAEDGKIWVRPKKMFLEQVELEGKKLPRFAKLSGLNLKMRDIIYIVIFPFLVFMLNYALDSLAREWTQKWSVDTPLHFLGGFSIAISAVYIYKILEKNEILVIRNRFVKILLICAVVALAAVIWEIYEFASDHFLGTHGQASNDDTMKDLMMGLLGGFVYGAIVIRKALE